MNKMIITMAAFFLVQLALLAQNKKAEQPKSQFHYSVQPNTQPDVSIIPLGNATGRIMAFELIAGLPIIFDLRSHMQSTSVIAGETEFIFDYTSAAGETASNLRKFGGNNYEKTLTFTDGLQPVISYSVNGKMKVCWPMDLKNHSREWIETSNVLKTVMRNDDIELTAIDFADVSNDMIVRRTSVKNIGVAKLEAVKILHYAPVNPSGRKSTAGFSKGWYKIDSTNYSCYDKKNDCLLFSDGNTKWWMIGSNQPSIAHDCNNYPATRAAINNNALSGKNSSRKGLVDAALSYGNLTLAPGKNYSVDFFIGYANNSNREAALASFAKNNKNLPAQKRLNTTLSFWKDWFVKGNIPITANSKLNDYIKRELMLIKVQEFWTGGLPSDAMELSAYYFRDAARPAYALSLFGYHQEAQNVMLALAAITTRKGYCNAYSGVEQWIKDITINGIPGDTQFPETVRYSADDPDVILTFIGKIYEQTRDKNFIKKIWPLIPYTIDIARRDMGIKGTVAQVHGFQDDMIHWAQQRPETAPGEKGPECSYWNMFWVTGIEHAAKIARDLGYQDKADEYSKLANLLRENIEKTLWREKEQRYCYYYEPKKDEYVFLDTLHFQRRAHGAPIAIQSGYLQPDHPHAIAEWKSMKTIFESHIPFKDAVIAKYSASGQGIGRYLFAKANSGDADLDKYFDWYLTNIPFAGVAEYLPFHFRVQTWTRGEMLMGMYEYIKVRYPESLAEFEKKK